MLGKREARAVEKNKKRTSHFSAARALALRGHLMQVVYIQMELKFGNGGFHGGKETGEPSRKLLEGGENKQQTEPTYDLHRGQTFRAVFHFIAPDFIHNEMET